MRITRKTVVAIIIALFCAAGCADRGLTRSKLKALQKQPLPAFTPPEVSELDLKNGARLFLLEDHTLPIVNLSIIIKAGSIYEPEDRLGLVALMSEILRDGGTSKMTPDEVDALVDDTAIKIGFAHSREIVEGSVKSLTSEFDTALKLIFEMLFNPRFDRSRLEVDRLQFIEQLKRDEDDPETVAARDFRKLVYGTTSPWARWPEPKDVKRITAGDIRKFWMSFVRPDNMLIAAAGDFDKEKLIARLEQLTKDAPNAPVNFPSVEKVKRGFEAEQRYVKKNINQDFIYMGHLGIKRHNPDKFALQVMNTVLGGGSFKSRLMEEIRTTRGLAYSVWSYFSWGTDYGLFSIYAATRAENEVEVITLIQNQVTRLADTGEVTDHEYRFAKDVVINRLIFEFDNSFKIARSRAQYYFWGYPPNYWEVYRDGIKAVTKMDIKRVAHKYLHPNALKTLIVGPGN